MNRTLFTLSLFAMIFVAGGCGLDSPVRPAENVSGLEADVAKGGSQGVGAEEKGVQGGDTIDLSGRGLTEFPSDVLDQTGVRILRLSGNRIASLPSQIGRLTELEELYLDGNRLTGALPAEIRMMSGLKILDASGNQLTGIPAEIGQLKELKTLDLSDNDIDTYPNEIANLERLDTLDLSGNRFSGETLDEIERLLPGAKVVR